MSREWIPLIFITIKPFYHEVFIECWSSCLPTELYCISKARWLLLYTVLSMILFYFVCRRFQFITSSRSLRSLFLCKCVSRARDRWRTPCRGTLNCFLYNIQILWRFFFFSFGFCGRDWRGWRTRWSYKKSFGCNSLQLRYSRINRNFIVIIVNVALFCRFFRYLYWTFIN